jgi:solute:Na+ symporter, SSS family
MSGITWVYIMLGIYVIYAFWQGLQGFFAEKTSAGYAIGGRRCPSSPFSWPPPRPRSRAGLSSGTPA